MTTSRLVFAISKNQQRSCLVNTSSQILNQVECGFICPMDIFQDQDRWNMSFSKALIQRSSNDKPICARTQWIQQMMQITYSYIVNWSQWTGSEQRITGAPKDAQAWTK